MSLKQKKTHAKAFVASPFVVVKADCESPHDTR